MFNHLRIVALALLVSLFFTTTLQANQVSPTQGETGVYGIDLDTGKVLVAINESNLLAPASTTKLMTALLVLRKDKLDDQVVVGREVVGVESANLGLEPGDRISVENLLYALLMASSNESATALAAFTSGNVEKFVAEMNAEAQQLGLQNTKFVNPNGLPAAGHVTTAKELATIAKTALANSTISNIVKTREHIITWQHGNVSKSLRLDNTNRFLGVYPGVEGAKTGTTTEAGQCLITYANWTGHRILLIVLNSANRYIDTKNYLDIMYTQLQLDRAGRDLVENLPISI